MTAIAPQTPFLAYEDGALAFDGVPLADLAAAYDTPLYVYSRGAILQAYDAMQAAFAGLPVTICYAMKANSNQAVLTALARRGAGADVVSGGELHRALEAGIPPERIVFAGVGKSTAELAQAVAAEIAQINVESLPELDAVAAIAASQNRTARIAIRVNPDVDALTHEKISTGRREDKFGIDIDEALEVYAKAAAHPSLAVTGVAVHIGSQLLDLEPCRSAFRRVALLVHALRDSGIAIGHVDLGGGLGIVYRDETPPALTAYAALIREIIAPLNTQIWLEPGRSLVGNAGLLLSRVVLVKDTAQHRYLVLDAAMNDLLRPALYDAYHSILPVVAAAADAPWQPTEVVGPVCESGDTFARARPLPPLAAGDLVAFQSAGAYGFTMASRYNTRPIAAEALVGDGRHALIRRRETLAEILAAESVPDWV